MNILLVLFSLIIIYPILLFLPIALNAKQKLFLLFISLLISVIGIWSVNLLPLLQTFLLMIAFAGLFTILLKNKMKETQQQTALYKMKNDQANLQYPVPEKTQKVEEEENVIISVDKEEMENVGIATISTSNIEVGEDEERLEEEMHQEALFEEIHVNQYVAASIELDDDLEEIEFLYDLEPLEEIEISEESSTHIDSIESTPYLSEIEKLLQDDEFDRILEEDNKVEKIEVEDQSETSQLKEFKLEKLY